MVMVAAAYLPALGGGFIWDDDYYVRNNPTLRSLDGLRRIWFEIGATPQYYPMVHSTYWIEYRLWGLEPMGYHAVNIALHAVAALLLWRILTFLHVPGAWAAAAIFALHPVHVESVAWITERKNVLSAVFYFGAALAYLYHALPLAEGRSTGKSGRFYALSLALFFCALLSKTVACTLPVVLLLVIWWKRGRVSLSDARKLAPFFVVGIAFGILTVWLEKENVGAAGEEWRHSFIERCLIAGRAICFYVGKLVRPERLTFFYPRWAINAGEWRQYVYPIAAISVIVGLWLVRRRAGEAPLVAALCFAVMLFPALGFFDVFPMRYSYVADHFQYLASAAVIALFAAMGAVTVNRLGTWRRGATGILLAGILATLGALTWRQGYVYRDLETLWRDTLRKNPDAWMAHNNLGNILQSQGKLGQAAAHYRQTLQLVPDHAEARYNLGNVLRLQGKHDEATSHYQEVVRIRGGHAKAQYHMGMISKAAGDFERAIGHFRQAVRISPDFTKAHFNLGLALVSRGELDSAIDHFRETLRFDPEHAGAHYNLGNALAMSGRLDGALQHLRDASRLAPNDVGPMHSLARVLATHPDPTVRKPGEAIRLAQRAAELTGHRDPVVLDTLAAAYAAAGQFDRAVAVAQQALDLAAEVHADDLADPIRARLELYRQGQPYREQHHDH